MTIRQQGGIFGRNPTFNDVDIDGSLNVDGSLTSGNLTVGGVSTLQNHVKVTNGYSVGWDDLSTRITGNSSTDLLQAYTDATKRFEITAAGNVNVSTGNLVISTSGNGIDFSATSGTGTSELFDDYEEGTWTPVLNGSTTNPTYTTSAYYTKIGNIVTVTGKLTFTTSGSGNYIITIASLPFSPSPDSPTGTMSVLDSGAAWYSGTVRGDAVNLISYIGTTIFSSTAPFTVASGDSLNCTITYRTS
jgi:hypothetical protein